MTIIHVESVPSVGYDVIIDNGVRNNLFSIIRKCFPISGKAFLLVDEKVADLYLKSVSEPLINNGVRVEPIIIPSGEIYKSFPTYKKIISSLVTSGLERRSALILLGGGVIMDLGGFVGATVMRGIPVINIPTTLLSQVDASIGGKVAIDLNYGKNLVGSFYNPKIVIIDPTFLKTLEEIQIREGLAEVIKAGIIGSPELFNLVEKENKGILNKNLLLLEELVNMAVKVKLKLLENDPLEINLERVLNFGHTIAHPLETFYQYKGLSHGMCVGIGMATSARFAVSHNYCSIDTANRIINGINDVGLPSNIAFKSAKKMCEGLEIIKRIRNGDLNFVVPIEIGKAIIIKQVDPNELVKYLI